MTDTYTNSRLSTARDCGYKEAYRYDLRLEVDTEDEAETLAVGTFWHDLHDRQDSGLDPFDGMYERAPSELWAVKMSRLFVAYQQFWSQSDDGYEIVPEQDFRMEVPTPADAVAELGDKIIIEGMLDARMTRRDDAGEVLEVGLMERKTTSLDISDDSDYWDRLPLDTQTSTYEMAMNSRGIDLDFVIYDVVRKPTINPKNLLKKDLERMRAEAENGAVTYCGETFAFDLYESVPHALEEGRECAQLYGARLAQDIAERPSRYFARRTVVHSPEDLELTRAQIFNQIRTMAIQKREGILFRNPAACHRIGLGKCPYFGLCTNGQTPTTVERDMHSGLVPPGFVVREKLHPEL